MPKPAYSLNPGKERNQGNLLEVKRKLFDYGFPNYFQYIEKICNFTKNRYPNYNWVDYDWFGGNGIISKLKKTWTQKTFSLSNRQSKTININDRKHKVHTLLSFKHIFDKYGLKFYLDGGTLLGAVREKDIIEYDADNDIAILVEDLPLLLKVVPELIKIGYIPCSYNSFLEICFVGQNDYIDVRFRPRSQFNQTLDKIDFLEEEFMIPNNVDKF